MTDEDISSVLTVHDARPEHVEALALLREIRDELRGLRADRPTPLVAAVSRLDRERCGAFLPAVSDAVGDEPWTCRDLLNRAIDADPLLRIAIDASIGLDDASCRRLGKLLARVENFDLDGFRVERIDEHPRDGCIWRVVRL